MTELRDATAQSGITRAVEGMPSIEAVALAERSFSDAGGAQSPLLMYRTGAESQLDWMEELGRLRALAQHLGLDAQAREAFERACKLDLLTVERDSNDQRQRNLHEGMAPFRVIRFLIARGWLFDAWPPPTGRRGDDVDLQLVAPNGTKVNVQVKASDRPGNVLQEPIPGTTRFISNEPIPGTTEFVSRRRDGENDDHALVGIRKACFQLRASCDVVTLIVVCAQRDSPLSQAPQSVAAGLLGRTVQTATGVYLPRDRWGVFLDERSRGEWEHVSAVVLLDFVRGVACSAYACTTFANPHAKHSADAGWFTPAQVLVVEDNTVRWRGGAPEGSGVPTGTRIVERPPA
ncbi:MAG: hypothetical protein IPK60_09310 [Sandaracinaceae bacterium]|nr:hypothetical protein [Sandaracinaceae bacterium]